MHGTGARFNLASVFAPSAGSTGHCFRGADNGRAGTRRGTHGLIGRPAICTAGPSTSPSRVFAMSTGSI
jgi:hypothetical protein